MGKCLSKKSKLNESDNLSRQFPRPARSCTPDPIGASIEILLEDSQSKAKINESKSDPLDDPSAVNHLAKEIVNSIHRNQKPREDLKEVQTEILKATKLVENTLKITQASKSTEKIKGLRGFNDKGRSKSLNKIK
jgi:hypothetical protein